MADRVESLDVHVLGDGSVLVLDTCGPQYALAVHRLRKMRTALVSIAIRGSMEQPSRPGMPWVLYEGLYRIKGSSDDVAERETSEADYIPTGTLAPDVVARTMRVIFATTSGRNVHATPEVTTLVQFGSEEAAAIDWRTYPAAS